MHHQPYPAQDATGARFPVSEPFALILMATLVFLCYANTFTSPFIFDDIINILENPHIRLKHLSPDSLKDAAFKSPSTRRPVANLSFAFNHYIDGYNVAGYHLFNLILHIATGILLYYTLKKGLSFSLNKSAPEEIGLTLWSHGLKPGEVAVLPYATACLWLVHPLQTQSVTYLVQRMNVLAALFFMLAVLLFLTAQTSSGTKKRVGFYLGCAVCGLLAVASKENAATLPLFLLLYRWFFLLDLKWQNIRKEILVVFLAAAVLLGLVFLFMGPHPLERIQAGYSGRPFTMDQRVLTEFRVVVFYVSLFFFPHPGRLNLDHHFPVSVTMIDPLTTLFSIAAIGGALVAAIVWAKRYRVVSFCILWYLGNLVIESSVISLEIIFEHRNYLPSMGLVLLVAWLLYRKIKSGRALAVLFGCIVVILSFWTYQRNKVWQDDLSLWQDCAHKSPVKSRPVNQYGVALEKRGRLEEAADSFRQAIRSRPASPPPYHNLGNVLVKLGRHDEAITQYARALHLKPDYPEARNNLAIAYAQTGQVTKSIELFQLALAA